MIVRTFPDHLELITQPDHARLAGTIMERCAPLVGHPRRSSILDAIAGHDNGWAEEDAAPTVDGSGMVADFISVPVIVRQRVWPRAVGRLSDPWTAALVAHHAVTVYDRFRADAAWHSFFAQMTALRDANVRASGLPVEDLLTDYPFLRLGDLISLAFCTDSSDEQRFGGWSVQLSGTHVVVTPNPFADQRVPIEITAKDIPNRRFASEAELRAAVLVGKEHLLIGTT